MIDVNDLRVIVTVLSFALFIALAVHTWSRRRRREHDAAAMLPFADEADAGAGCATTPDKPQGERRE